MELSRRDRYALIIGGVFLAVFSLYRFVWLPAADKRVQLEKIDRARDAAILEMQTLSNQYLEMSSQNDRQRMMLEHRSPGFTLFSFLDAQAQKSGVKKHVAFMKPFSKEEEGLPYRISTVKVKLKDVYSKGLVEFLSRIEGTGNNVRIVHLSLNKSGKKGEYLDAILEAQTFVPKQGERK